MNMNNQSTGQRQVANDANDTELQQLDDLGVDEKTDAEIKGGPSSNDSRIIKITNHNETVAEDKDDSEGSESETLEDLDAQNDEEVKAGGLKTINHNETVTEDKDDENNTARLEDLPVSDEQGEGVAGGLPAVQAVREAASRNHNETVAEDSENDEAPSAEQNALADLEPNGEIKGGPSTSDSRIIKITNHNETLISDEAGELTAETLMVDLNVNNELADKVSAGSDVIVTREDKDRRGKTIDKSSPILMDNHNETIAEDKEDEASALEDLPVSDQQSEGVAGGLPAVQKVRDAAARMNC